MMNDDSLIYLGKVSQWLKDCPDGTTDYGEFYVAKVSVVFDGDLVGVFTSDDPSWIFEERRELLRKNNG